MRLGTVLSKSWDDKGYERRVQIRAIVACPICGKDVELTSETEEWRKGSGGLWYHASYDACPSGDCCDRVLIYNGLEGRLMTLNPPEKGGG